VVSPAQPISIVASVVEVVLESLGCVVVAVSDVVVTVAAVSALPAETCEVMAACGRFVVC
jgi:hypothetical protein